MAYGTEKGGSATGTADVAVDTVAGADFQRVKLVDGTEGNTGGIPGTATDGLTVNLGANNDVTVTGTVTANVAAGTNNIGDVDVLTVPAPLSTSGHGTAAAALRVELPTDGTGVIATVGAVTAISSALPAGSNAIGKLAANSGVDIGDVDVTSVSGNVTVVQGTATSLKAEVVGTGTFVTQESGAALTSLQLIDDAVNASDTALSKVIAVGAQFDDTSPGTTTEDRIRPIRMSTRREVYAQIRDAAGNERGLNVDSNGAVAITAASLPSHAVTNAGTFVTQIDGAALTSLQLADDVVYTDDTSTHSTGSSKGTLIMAAAAPTDASVDANDIGAVAMTTARALKTDMTTIAGTAPSVGSGTATGALRVELPTNGTGVIASVTAITNALPAGTNAIGKLAANSGVDIGDVDVTSTTLPTLAATGTVTSVNDSNVSATLLSSSATRKGWRVYNDSTQDLFIKFGTTASTTDFTVLVPPGGFYAENHYYGRVDGVWRADASGAARITELT